MSNDQPIRIIADSEFGALYEKYVNRFGTTDLVDLFIDAVLNRNDADAIALSAPLEPYIEQTILGEHYYFLRSNCFSNLGQFSNAAIEISKLNRVDLKYYCEAYSLFSYIRNYKNNSIPIDSLEGCITKCSLALRSGYRDVRDVCYMRGLCYQLIGNYIDAFKDFNSSVYFRLSKNAFLQDNTDTWGDSLQIIQLDAIFIIASFYEKTDCLYDLYCLKKYYSKIDSYNKYLSIRDFVLLLEYKRSTMEQFDFDRFQSVLSYHLGGSVSSFITFDEILDNGVYALSAQELFFYVRASMNLREETGVGLKSILEDAIKELKERSNNAEDEYYLGHLLLLANNKTDALEAFQSSKKKRDSKVSRYSEIMCRYLSGTLSSMKIIEDLLPDECNIDVDATELDQFSDYFHLSEICMYKTISSYYGSYVRKHLWEIYHLRLPEEERLLAYLNSREAKALLDNMEKEIESKCDNPLPITCSLGDYIHTNFLDTFDIESVLATRIQTKMSKSEFILYKNLIDYFFHIGRIDTRQTIMLHLYNEAMYSSYTDRTVLSSIVGTSLSTLLVFVQKDYVSILIGLLRIPDKIVDFLISHAIPSLPYASFSKCFIDYLRDIHSSDLEQRIENLDFS